MPIEKKLLVTAGMAILVVSCSPSHSPTEKTDSAPVTRTTPTPAEPKASVPASVTNMGEFAENIYDAAKAKNWNVAQEKLKALNDAIAQARTQSSVQVQAASLDPALAALSKAIGSKNRQAAMHRSNYITSIAADLADPFHPAVPADINRLDFYGRELQVWSAENNTGKLHSTVQDVRKTWDRVRPAVESHGGQSVAAKFDGLVVRAEKAKTSAQFRNVATPILDEVDHLEKVFEK